MQGKQEKKNVLMQYLKGNATALAITTVFMLVPVQSEALKAEPSVKTPDIENRLANIRKKLMTKDTERHKNNYQSDPLQVLAQWNNWPNYQRPPWYNWNNWPNWPNYWQNYR